MDALKLLETQHREAEALFEMIEKADSPETKRRLMADLADALAVHMAIEEQIFYPQTNASRTEDLLLEAVEEHLAAKRSLADILIADPAEKAFDAKVKVLKEMIEHHVEEEEDELFPTIKKTFDAEALEAMGGQMEALAAEMQDENPRLEIPNETSAPAPIE
jgi:hemerythrin-like domain-containing protein